MKHLGIAALLSLLMTGASMAQTSVLIMGIEDYERVADVRYGDEANALISLTQNTERPIEPNAAQFRERMAQYEARSANAARQLIVLSGRFVHTTTETYFLPRDARSISLASIPGSAIPISSVLAMLAATPGEAVLALATDDTDGGFGRFLKLGLGDIDLPQGVTLLTGEPRDVTRAISTLLRQPGSEIADVAGQNDVAVSGFLRDGQVLRDAPAQQPAPTQQTPTQSNNAGRVADLLAWRQADRANTPEAYEEYIAAHPRGQFVRMAQSRLQALVDTPEARAERDEQRLDLNRDQRREIQRALTLLDYNTRGIDGIFGRGTRAAISSWQQDNGFARTGFVNEEQLRQLDTQARRRAAQLEAEAQARREAQQALDRAYWEETGALGDAAGSRAYLERFPDGEYADIARERLQDFEREKRRQTDARDRQLWDEAVTQDTLEAYEDYLIVSPNGSFREEAEDRIAEIRFQSSGAVVEARNEENNLRMTPATRRMVEARLDGLGLEPGPVDGEFTPETRRAIRLYQRARDFPQTGYLTSGSIVRLLADGVHIQLR